MCRYTYTAAHKSINTLLKDPKSYIHFLWWNLPGIYVKFTSYLLNTHCMQSAINARPNHWPKHQFWFLPPCGRLTTNTWLALYSLCLIIRCPPCSEAAEERSIHRTGENSRDISLTTAQCSLSFLKMKKRKKTKNPSILLSLTCAFPKTPWKRMSQEWKQQKRKCHKHIQDRNFSSWN